MQASWGPPAPNTLDTDLAMVVTTTVLKITDSIFVAARVGPINYDSIQQQCTSSVPAAGAKRVPMRCLDMAYMEVEGCLRELFPVVIFRVCLAYLTFWKVLVGAAIVVSVLEGILAVATLGETPSSQCWASRMYEGEEHILAAGEVRVDMEGFDTNVISVLGVGSRALLL